MGRGFYLVNDNLTMTSTQVLKKVTAFVTRQGKQGRELLLFKHPYAGIQFPAGSVEPDEEYEVAAWREVAEETGLTEQLTCNYLETVTMDVGASERVLIQTATLYARPDATSFDWVKVPRGTWVKALRLADGFTQISYVDLDDAVNPTYESFRIVGWMANEALTRIQERAFFHFDFTGETPDTWEIFVDYHRFQLFWAPVENVPEIIAPQRAWLDIFYRHWPV